LGAPAHFRQAGHRDQPDVGGTDPDGLANAAHAGAGDYRCERDTARELFAEVWSEIGGEGGDPFHRCALAHAMADVQGSAPEELTWDLRALRAADLTSGRPLNEN
jgi:hypothetical protein